MDSTSVTPFIVVTGACSKFPVTTTEQSDPPAAGQGATSGGDPGPSQPTTAETTQDQAPSTGSGDAQPTRNDSRAQDMLDIRRLTAVGLNVRPSHVLKLADALSDAIETVMNNLSQPARLLKEDVDIFEWPLQVEYEGDSPHHVTIRVVKDSGKWKISRELMESVLSLWVSSTRERHEAARSNIRDHPNDFGLRLLGKTSSKLQRDLGCGCLAMKEISCMCNSTQQMGLTVSRAIRLLGVSKFPPRAFHLII
jgi:hypothetical protein